MKKMNGWKLVEIGEVAEVVTGNTPSRKSPHYFGGSIPWVKPPDVNNQREVKHSEEYLSEEGAKCARILPKGSVMVTCIGNIGNVAIAGTQLATNQQINSIVIKDENILPKYVYYQALTWKKWLYENSTSTTISMINKSRFSKAPFILAPLPEQKRIVAKLDTLFAHLDQLRSRLDKIPVLLKQFRQAVLTKAVTGKLTEEWRGENTSNSSGRSFPFRIPDKWRFVQLNEVCRKFTYGTSAKSEDIGEVAVLRMGNIQNGKIDWSDLKYTSDRQEIEKYCLTEGDVLFNRTNSPELVGKACVYDGQLPAIYAGYLIKIWNGEQVNSHFLNIILNSPYGRDWSWRSKSDGVSQSNINAKKLAAFEIPLPPIKEQRKIVNKVESLLATVEIVETSLAVLMAKIDRLGQSIILKAFQGELIKNQVEKELKACDQLAEDLLAAAEPTNGL